MWHLIYLCHKGSSVKLPIPFFLMERNGRCFHGGWNDIHPSHIFTYEETSQAKMAKDSFCKEGLKIATMKAGLGKNNKKLSTAPQSEVHIPSGTNEASTEFSLCATLWGINIVYVWERMGTDYLKYSVCPG